MLQLQRNLIPVVLLGLISVTAAKSDAGPILGFENITANSATDAAIGEAQLFVELSEPAAGQVAFRFFNIGPGASSITDIYFDDDGLLSGIAALIDSDDGEGGDPGVDFSPVAAPPDLPGGNGISPPFVATAGLSLDSDPPAQPNGVNPGEELTVIYDLVAGQTFADLLFGLGSDPAGLRIGIHVQGFASGGSESFVNLTPPSSVPEPGALGLLGLGLLAVLARKRGAR